MSDLKGVCVPVCTPFTNSGAKVDERALRNHLDSMIEAGVHIIAVNGGTGEFPFLSVEEKRMIAEVSARHIDGRSKLIVQTSAIRTEDAIEASKHAEAQGADALLILPPFFEGPGADGVRWHFEQISRAVATPIMVYNIPQYSGFDVTPQVWAKLAQFGTVEYIKDSMANMLRLEQLVEVGAKVFCGCDYLNLYALLAGCVGCFWGGANAMPREAVELYELFEQRKLEDALVLWRRMQPLNIFLWTNPFNPAAKAASNLSGRPVGECRRPVLPLSAEQKEVLEEAMRLLLAEETPRTVAS